MNPLIENILNEPQAYYYVSEIQRILKQESLKRKEFYEKITPNDKAEFINGEIIFQSPVKLKHNRATLLLVKVLDTFVYKLKAGLVGFEKLLISLTRNDYEPDICYFSQEKAKKFKPNQMQFPAPDFVVEILSSSTENIDRIIKFKDYAAHGIAEYWIIDPENQTIEQYILKNGVYQLFLKSNNGEIESVVIKGFRIPIQAIFNEKINMETLDKIIRY